MYWDEDWLQRFVAKMTQKETPADGIVREVLLDLFADRLVSLAVQTEEAASHLAEFLKECDFEMKVSIFEAMMSCPKGPGASRILQQFLIDPEVCSVRWPEGRPWLIAVALESIGPAATAEAVQFLINALHDPSIGVRKTAAHSLRCVPGSEAAVPFLKQCLRDPDWDVQEEAFHALRAIKPERAELGETIDLDILLYHLIHCNSPDYCDQARGIARAISLKPSDRETLERALGAHDPWIKEWATKGLERLRSTPP
jgi:HEAT repeat protein